MLRCFFLILLLLFATAGFAQGDFLRKPGTSTQLKGTLSGNYYSYNEGIEGIKVQLFRNDSLIDSCLTDAWGFYFFPLFSEGRYSIEMNTAQTEELYQHTTNTFSLRGEKFTNFIFTTYLLQFCSSPVSPSLSGNTLQTAIALSDTNAYGAKNEVVLFDLLELLQDYPWLILRIHSLYNAKETSKFAVARLKWCSNWLEENGVCPGRILGDVNSDTIYYGEYSKLAPPPSMRFSLIDARYDLAAFTCPLPLEQRYEAPEAVFPVFRFQPSSRVCDTLLCQANHHTQRPSSAELESAIDSLAEVLLQRPLARLRITGHCASNEAPDLSWVRAADVAQLFINRGVTLEQLEIVGLEASDPVIPDKKVERWREMGAGKWSDALNRRVTLLLALPTEMPWLNH